MSHPGASSRTRLKQRRIVGNLDQQFHELREQDGRCKPLNHTALLKLAIGHLLRIEFGVRVEDLEGAILFQDDSRVAFRDR